MTRTHQLKRIGLGVALMALAGAIFAFLIVGESNPGNSGISSHGQPITAVRTLLVAGSGPVELSAPGEPLRALLVSGSASAMPAMATVLSDEDCAPDAQGVSHCTNRLRMMDGTQMTVTHPHRMAEVPCLAPGERVSVQAV